jgi:methylenetetrahydrofolate dehydrogenase (NADP+)/methenyltetrahydrofolate cyclohydrolase
MIIDGNSLAAQMEAETKERANWLIGRGIRPGLATILVGSDPGSEMYIRIKHSACNRVGIRSENIVLPEDAAESQLILKIKELNERSDINGILLQLPLPKVLDSPRAMATIDPEKDVDGFHPENMGALLLGIERLVPCTAKGIIYALDQLGVCLEGKEVVIVGHSNVVGKPLAAMMLNRNATVQVCHIFTKDLPAHTKRAEILVVAVGVPGLIKRNMVQEGVYIFDVGISQIGNRIVGDVDFDSIKDLAAGITPVPGGVGPLTVAMLMSQTVLATEIQTRRQ